MTDAEKLDIDEQAQVDSHTARLTEELRAIRDGGREQKEMPEARSRVIEGLSEVRSERILPGTGYRFLVTAAVQSDPTQLGEWLDGDGSGFEAVDRPVNTSLIDQDHNWTFEGRSGYILSPPKNGGDIIAASPHDFGSSDLEPQPIELTSDELLEQTSPEGYNQVNIKSGSLAGVFIRLREDGSELGDSGANEQLRTFAATHGKPVVEIVTQPQRLEADEPTMDKVSAKGSNDLWKVRFPEAGLLQEVDIIRFQPGEQPRGFTIDPTGFDFRVRNTDGYGETSDPTRTREGLHALLDRLSSLEAPSDPQDRKAIAFVVGRVQQQLRNLEQQ